MIENVKNKCNYNKIMVDTEEVLTPIDKIPILKKKKDGSFSISKKDAKNMGKIMHKAKKEGKDGFFKDDLKSIEKKYKKLLSDLKEIGKKNRFERLSDLKDRANRILKSRWFEKKITASIFLESSIKGTIANIDKQLKKLDKGISKSNDAGSNNQKKIYYNRENYVVWEMFDNFNNLIYSINTTLLEDFLNEQLKTLDSVAIFEKLSEILNTSGNIKQNYKLITDKNNRLIDFVK